MDIEQDRDEEQQQEIEQPATGATPEGQFVVNLDDDDDDAGTPGADPDTLDKRGRRSYVRTLKKDLESTRAEAAELRERMARLEGRASAPQPQYQPAQQQEANPYEAHLDAIENQMDALRDAVANGDKAKQADYIRQYKHLDRQRLAIVAQSMQQQAPQQERGPSVQAQMLRAQFPDIYRSRALVEEARLEAIRLAERRGVEVDYAIAAEANQRVMARRARPAAPTPGVQAKFTGVPARAGATGGGNMVTMDKSTMRMAQKYYEGGPFANLSDNEKYKKFARDVLSKPE